MDSVKEKDSVVEKEKWWVLEQVRWSKSEDDS